MNQVKFNELDISPEIKSAIEDIGFETATEIQSKAIPMILAGRDVIGKSQTGTGKTLAFGIPAIEMVDRESNAVQVLILCPTRELVVQACEELHKITKFAHNIKIVDVYGGAPMDRQILKLKKASVVIGTPGRIMDHMRRKTLKLDNLKMVVLDEADEMLSMGFREDIETILDQTPEDRQTILFSATMPPEIFALTHKYQKSPEMIEVNKKQVTVENIKQTYYDVPMGRKMDALNLILKYHNPNLGIIFCNTKKMVDDVTEYLLQHGFSVQGIHGDMKQPQRMKVMNSFKKGYTGILVATDVAARGIDVNNIDYVINYDIPQNTEYYVHRIGRTGRAGKSGVAITICSGRRQVDFLKRIGKLVRAKIEFNPIPKPSEIVARQFSRDVAEVERLIKTSSELKKLSMVDELEKRGYDPKIIAAAVLELHFDKSLCVVDEIKTVTHDRKSKNNGSYKKIVINVGRSKRVAPNHIVGAITERTNLSGRDIGKIEIYDDKTVVSVPSHNFNDTVSKMKNCKICGNPTVTKVYKANKR